MLDPSVSDSLAPGLYIVATPIGNLDDVTARAVTVLRRADLIAAEDTRMTAKLLFRLRIKAPMIAYHDHSDTTTRACLVEHIKNKAVALVCDAGTPLICDPGYKLVRDARAAGCFVTTLPGPCAAIAALTLAALPTDRFLFAGFLPPKPAARMQVIAEFTTLRATLVFYENGRNLAASLAALAEGLGNRRAAVVREITKIYEECLVATLSELATRTAETPPKGEIVILVAPNDKTAAKRIATAGNRKTKTTGENSKQTALDAALDSAIGEELASKSVAKTAKIVAARFGLKRSDIYQRALALRNRA